MRKYLASIALSAGLVIASPFVATAATSTESSESQTIAVHKVRVPAPGGRDQASMVIVGTALIGLAAAVRRRAV